MVKGVADLWCQSRHSGYGGELSELLAAMDIAAEARILTLASTNDAATLDEAAIRTGRSASSSMSAKPSRSKPVDGYFALVSRAQGVRWRYSAPSAHRR